MASGTGFRYYHEEVTNIAIVTPISQVDEITMLTRITMLNHAIISSFSLFFPPVGAFTLALWMQERRNGNLAVTRDGLREGQAG